jgi:hypothetical protein
MRDCIGERIGRCQADGCTYRSRMDDNARSQSPRLRRTTLRPGQPLGSAEITHPFHPLRGQRFVVLKINEVAGVEILSLRHTETGSLAVRREWTAWAAPGTSREPISGQQPLLIDAPGLLALADLISSLKRKRTT